MERVETMAGIRVVPQILAQSSWQLRPKGILILMVPHNHYGTLPPPLHPHTLLLPRDPSLSLTWSILALHV